MGDPFSDCRWKRRICFGESRGKGGAGCTINFVQEGTLSSEITCEIKRILKSDKDKMDTAFYLSVELSDSG